MSSTACTSSIEEIRELLSRLRARDKQFKVFGSNQHGYRPGPPLGEKALREFEVRNGVSLPAEYRVYLSRVGDGGAGPFYGLSPLEQAARGCRLQNRFPADASKDHIQPDEIDPDWFPGALELCHQGCAIYTYLVLNGPHRGTMWDGCDGEFYATKMSFAEWFRSWITRALRALENERFTALLRVGMTKDDVIAATAAEWKQRPKAAGQSFFEADDIPVQLVLDERGIVIHTDPWPFITARPHIG